ncbi:MAG: histidinol-phosphatase [Pygmaiobacter sp.]|nr:histidinol-phosphatase [Pygmaiobacter sp.]
MKLTGSVHNHTTFCGDGKNTIPEMAQAAYDAGLATIGFSEHSYVPAEQFGVPPEQLPAYQREVKRVAAAWQGRLEVLLGLEVDTEAPPLDLAPYDYIIGSSHAVCAPNGSRWPIDMAPEVTARCIAEGFGGDALAFVKAYYEQFVAFLLQLRPTIVGHFDLVRKFNGAGQLFDETSPAYLAIVRAALREVLAQGMVLEVNTGAISRGWRTDPYPADPLLQDVLAAGGHVIVTADAHSCDALTCAFDETVARLRALGFREVQQLTAAGFVPCAI